MMFLNVFNRLAGVVAELSTITKIHKYRGLHEGRHFILMAMEVHDALECDMDHFIMESGAYFFHDRQLECHFSLYVYIKKFRQRVSITFQCALVFSLKRKITLASAVFPRPRITIRSHDLHANNIRGVVGEITSYHERD
jgi:hypothetical protein